MRFFVVQKRHFCPKCQSLRPKKWHFEWPNQNSETTFIVQTFPKYCRMGFYFMKLSLLSPILAKFQFCWFSGLFWAFFPCKKCKKKSHFCSGRSAQIKKFEENKSGLEFNFLLKSKCPSLNFEIWVFGANLTEP